MNTFPVTPTPPQAFPGESPAASSQSGNENEFAPTLAKAMSDTPGSNNEHGIKASKNNPSKNSVEIDKKGEQEIEDIDVDDSSSSLLTIQAQAPQEGAKNIRRDHFPQGSNIFSSLLQTSTLEGSANTREELGNNQSNEISGLFQKGILKQSDVGQPTKTSTDNQPVTLDTAAGKVSSFLLGENSQLQQGTPGAFRLNSTSENTSTFIQQSTNVTKETSNQNRLMAKNDVLTQVTLGNEADAISWSQSKHRVPHVINQNYPVNVTYGGDTPAAKNPAISTESIIATLTDLSLETQPAKPIRQEAPSLRHDITNQYFEAKIKQPDLSGQTGSQDKSFEADSEQNAQNTSLNLSLKANDSVSDLNFSHSLQQQVSGDKLGQPPVEIFKPGLPLYNNPVFQDSLVHQVAQKMHINQQLQDSKIAIKLHPAELGELKIDIQIKEGTVHASIIAQNQTVQDILEKNMPKLKTLMEQNGLKVNDIVVTLDTDVPSDYNLFEEHLAQNEDNTNRRKNSQSNTAFQLNPEGDEIDNSITEDVDEGVNVKV